MTTDVRERPATLGRSARSGAALAGRELAGGVIPLIVLLLIWFAAHAVITANTFLRGPLQVARFLGEGAAISQLLGALASSIGLVVLGYAVAITVAVIVAAAMVLSTRAEQALMPLALIVGGLPIIVITPVLLMLLGRGLATAVLVCTVVTFFSCLINIIAGMRSPATQLIDLTRALGASPLTVMLRVRLPSAVPGLISASKLALPAALSGVILTEFIATGTGIGNYINHARANFLFDQMWAGIAATLIASVLLYTVLGAVEILLQRRYTPSALRERAKP